MPSYTLEELMKIMEPQARRDKELITKCIAGLGLYAAQQEEKDSGSREAEEMRDLAKNLIGYWGLDYGENAKPAEDIMWDFDALVDDAKRRVELPDVSPECAADTIFGLYRYGEDMVASQGEDAKGEILSMSLLMKRIGKAWEFNTPILDDLTERLNAEAIRMYQTAPLPGQPVNGKNAGYEIRHAILFDNDSGFVLGKSMGTPLFVTWKFDEENGKRNYYWGHYIESEAKARADFIYRAEDYVRMYKVTEKPIPTAAVEVDAEQNYNMIDGVRNNEAVPKPDLTDGQTFAEIKDLAPETLPEAERPEHNEAELNFSAWMAVTESSRYKWVEDEIYRLNGRGAMYYTGGEDGVYMRIQKDGKLEAGHYEGAVPHIGEATFKPAVIKQFPSFSESYKAAMEAGGKQFMVDMFSGDEPQPLKKVTGRSEPEERPSVLKEIREAQKTPKPPHKEKAPEKDRGEAER